LPMDRSKRALFSRLLSQISMVWIYYRSLDSDTGYHVYTQTDCRQTTHTHTQLQTLLHIHTHTQNATHTNSHTHTHTHKGCKLKLSFNPGETHLYVLQQLFRLAVAMESPGLENT